MSVPSWIELNQNSVTFQPFSFLPLFEAFGCLLVHLFLSDRLREKLLAFFCSSFSLRFLFTLLSRSFALVPVLSPISCSVFSLLCFPNVRTCSVFVWSFLFLFCQSFAYYCPVLWFMSVLSVLSMDVSSLLLPACVLSNFWMCSWLYTFASCLVGLPKGCAVN